MGKATEIVDVTLGIAFAAIVLTCAISLILLIPSDKPEIGSNAWCEQVLNPIGENLAQGTEWSCEFLYETENVLVYRFYYGNGKETDWTVSP